jgi:hypothetical protein
VEEFDPNDGSKCTKINISEKGSSVFKEYYRRPLNQDSFTSKKAAILECNDD